MKKFLKLMAITVIGLAVLTGCRTAAVYNVDKSPVEVKASTQNVYKAIKRAGISRGWIISQIRPGLAQGKLNVRNHFAVVEIPYNNKNFSINYKDSRNLKYDAAKDQIHNNYNGWVQNLERSILLELSALE